jgi:preprotein translocase subunit SecB
MSDQQPQQPVGTGDASAATGPQVQVTAQYVKDLSFENPNAAEILAQGAGAPKVAVNVDVKTNQLAENRWEVLLTIKGDAKSGDNQAFVVELTYGGIALLNAVPREQTAAVLLIEVPRLLFPFARAVISEATRNGGFPPLLIQPIDFAGMFRRQLETLRAQQQAAGAGAGPAAGTPETPVN